MMNTIKKQKMTLNVSINIIILIFTLLSCLSVQIVTSNGDDTSKTELKLVMMVHRHGDRNPIKSYPNDPFKNESIYWPDGFGELRPEGKKRLYKMGQMLRTRYSTFLTDNPREVHVRSSAADRCLESVSSLLAGLYPPSGRWVWNDNLNWQPFPIQTKPRPQDGMLVTTSICPAAEAELKRIRNSVQIKKFTEQFKDLFSFLHLNSGANVTDIIEAGNLCDVLKIERLAGHKLPPWATDNVMEQLLNILDMTFYFDFSTKLVQKFRAGLLFKDILHRTKYFIENHDKNDQQQHHYCQHGLCLGPDDDIEYIESPKNKKLFLYSSHDTQIAVTLQAMSSFNMKAPPYGSSILFELHQGSSQNDVKVDDSNNLFKRNKFYMKAFYWNETTSSTMVPLIVPGCNNVGLCPVHRFFEEISSFIPNNWSNECSLSFVDRINSAVFNENLIVSIMLGIVSISILCLALILLIKRFNSRKQTGKRRRQLNLIEDKQQLEEEDYE